MIVKATTDIVIVIAARPAYARVVRSTLRRHATRVSCGQPRDHQDGGQNESDDGRKSLSYRGLQIEGVGLSVARNAGEDEDTEQGGSPCRRGVR